MNGKDSLDLKIEKAVRASIQSGKSTKELIEYVSSNKHLNIFFNQISSNPYLKRLLFLHRFDLFGIEDEMQLPYFYLCNLPIGEKELSTQAESTALQYIVSSEIEVVGNGKTILQTMFGIDENKWKIFSEDLKDVVAYFAIKFIRSNPNIKRLINTEKFDYQIMKEILKDYKNTIDFDAFGKEIESAFETDQGEIDPAIKSKIERLIIQTIPGIMKNIEGFIESPKKMMPNYILPLHLSSSLWLRNLLSRSGLSFQEYLNVLDELYRNHLIENKSTIFWCENCNLENPSYSEHHGRIAPSKTTDTKCLNCDRTQSHASIYSLDSTLKDSIFSKDGLLAVYFGWLLKKEGIEFDEGSFSGKYENDFVIKKSIIVECKMFKSEKDPVAKRSEMINSFSQIEKHIEQLDSEGIEIKQAYLLWNRRDNEKALQKKLQSKYNELFKKYKLKIIYPDEIEETIEEM